MLLRMLAVTLALSSLLYANDVKLQLTEPFEYFGSDRYDEAMNFNGTQTQLSEFLLNAMQKSLVAEYGDAVAPRLNGAASEVISRDDQFVYVRGNMSRVERTDVLKGGTVVNIILSVSCGIEFYDLGSGETYYSRMQTLQTVTQRSVTSPMSRTERRELYVQSSQSLVDSLVVRARREYVPGSAIGTIVDQEGSLWIIDKGSTDGFVAGRNVIMEGTRTRLHIVDGNEALCLAERSDQQGEAPAVGKVTTLIGNSLERGNVARVLVFPLEVVTSSLFDSSLNVDHASANQWLRDYLSSYGDLNLVPLPGSLARTQVWASRRGTIAEQELVGNLTRPDYMAYPQVLYAFSTEEEGERGSVATLRVGVQMNIVDRLSGAILYNGIRHEIRSEPIAEGLRELDIVDEYPSVLKDALFELSKQVGTEFKSSVSEGIIARIVGDKMKVTDFKGLGNNQVLPLYRRVREVQRPQTKEVVGVLERRIGLVRLSSDGNDLIASPVSLTTNARPQDRIRGFSAQKALASATISVDSISSSAQGNGTSLEPSLVAGIAEQCLSRQAKLSPCANMSIAGHIGELNEIFEGGAYAVQAESPKFAPPTTKYKLNLTVIILDIQRPTPTKAILEVGARIQVKDAATDSVVFKDGLKQERELIGKASRRSVVVGLSDNDLQVNCMELCEMLLSELLLRFSTKI